MSPFRQHEFLDREKVLRISNYGIYFTSFHDILFDFVFPKVVDKTKGNSDKNNM
jgi:hypothetical protein